MKHIWTAAALVVFSSTAIAQEATVISEPSDDYLLEVTRLWSTLTELGDLRAKPLGEKDVELRVWGGYGIDGTEAVVLRRISGTWEGFNVHVREYTAAETDSLARSEGVFPPSILEAMAGLCTMNESRLLGSDMNNGRVVGALYHLSCPHAQRVAGNHYQESYVKLWQDMVDTGVLALPPELSLDAPVVDGHSYVVEVRQGDSYRASSIEHVALDASRQVQAIAKGLDWVLYTSLYPHWLDTGGKR
ncbi:MAG: hypothetical protein AAGI08_10795 [Bacteroidota bacterium]